MLQATFGAGRMGSCPSGCWPERTPDGRDYCYCPDVTSATSWYMRSAAASSLGATPGPRPGYSGSNFLGNPVARRGPRPGYSGSNFLGRAGGPRGGGGGGGSRGGGGGMGPRGGYSGSGVMRASGGGGGGGPAMAAITPTAPAAIAIPRPPPPSAPMVPAASPPPPAAMPMPGPSGGGGGGGWGGGRPRPRPRHRHHHGHSGYVSHYPHYVPVYYRQPSCPIGCSLERDTYGSVYCLCRRPDGTRYITDLQGSRGLGMTPEMRFLAAAAGVVAAAFIGSKIIGAAR